jgi:hypothetical protein
MKPNALECQPEHDSWCGRNSTLKIKFMLAFILYSVFNVLTGVNEWNKDSFVS